MEQVRAILNEGEWPFLIEIKVNLLVTAFKDINFIFLVVKMNFGLAFTVFGYIKIKKYKEEIIRQELRM